MSFKQVIELADLLDDGRVTGEDVVKYVTAEGNVKATCTTVTGAKGSTDFVKFLIPGKNGKTKGGTAPTLGIVGRLGGLGARPERIGFTSDGDGALAASAIAAKLARMTVRGDELEGDVIVGTHICPDAPTLPHKPAPFMDSPVTMDVLNKEEIARRWMPFCRSTRPRAIRSSATTALPSRPRCSTAISCAFPKTSSTS